MQAKVKKLAKEKVLKKENGKSWNIINKINHFYTKLLVYKNSLVEINP